MTLEEFFQELETNKPRYIFKEYSTGFIRNDWGECPLCAVANQKILEEEQIGAILFPERYFFQNTSYRRAAKEINLELTLPEIEQLANSADGIGGSQDIRSKFLNLCLRD